MKKYLFLLICVFGLSAMAQKVEETNEDEIIVSNDIHQLFLEHQEGADLININLDINVNDFIGDQGEVSFGNIGHYSLGISSTGGRIVPNTSARPARATRMNRDGRVYDAQVCKEHNDLSLLYAFLIPQLKAGNVCYMKVSENMANESGFCTNKNTNTVINFSVYYTDLIIPEEEKLKCKKVVHISLSQ